jgi:hypothetical protein
MRGASVAPIEKRSTLNDVQAVCSEALTNSVRAESRSAVGILEWSDTGPPFHIDNARPAAGTNKRRRISPQSGRGLEILGHAIEYLADEFAFHGGTFAALPAEDAQVRAIQLLMAANRSVYYECPIALTFRERLQRLWFHLVTNADSARRG